MKEFGEEAAKIRKIIDECLEPVESRPEMHIALDILRGPLTLHQKGMELHSEATRSGHTGILSSSALCSWFRNLRLHSVCRRL